MEFDWKKCVICQIDTSESLPCPLQTPGSSRDVIALVYENFLSNVSQFRDYDALPVDLKLDSNVTTDILYEQCASWHKTCYLKFGKSKLTKATQKRELVKDNHAEQRATKRRVIESKTCLFVIKATRSKLYMKCPRLTQTITSGL